MSADLSKHETETGFLADELAPLRDGIIARLNAVRRGMRLHFVAEGVAWIAATLTALAALTLLLDWWLELSLIARLCTLAAALAAVGYVVQRYLLRPMTLALAPIDVAAALDEAHNGGPWEPLAPRVASVLQLPEQLDEMSREEPASSGKPGFFTAEVSPVLIERAVRRSYDSLSGVDFQSGLNRKHLLWCLAGLATALLVPSAFGAAFPETARLWAERWLAGSNRPWPRDTHLEVAGVRDGRLIVPRGEPSSLQVQVNDDQNQTETVWMRLRSDDGRDETVTLTRFGTGDFRYELPPLQLPVNVTLWGGDSRRETFQIVPLDRPRIAALKLTAKSPRDAEPTVYNFTGAEGNVRLLPKTAATLELEANVPISEIAVEADAGQPLTFTRIDDRRFTASWTHDEPLHTRVTLTGRDVDFPSHPRPISIGQMPDRGPRVSLRHSGVRLRITPQATIPLTANTRDDFGIRRVDVRVDFPVLGTKPEESGDAEEPAATDGTADATAAEPESPVSNTPSESPPPAEPGAGNPTENMTPERRSVYGPADPATEMSIDQQLDLELESRQLQPGRLVSVYASAVDDCYTGEQTAESRKIIFRVVRPEELFREILLRQQQLRARLRKAADQAEDLRDRLPTASIPEDAPELLRTHQLIRREVGHVSRELDESVLEMRLNKLGGEETWALITNNVLKPLARLYEQEMEQQRQALESQVGANPDPFEEIVDRQQVIVDALSRILDNMAQWDSFIDVVNQLNSVITLERGVRQKTEELRKTQTESIFDK